MIMDQGERLFRLVARFTVHPGVEADFDELVRRATKLTLQNEQRVVTYICYQVEGQPQERIFYEEYENPGVRTQQSIDCSPRTAW
jgi:quinol monooxygenase YgiN